MRVVLAGGTGVIGRPATTALVDAGHEVVALVRSDDAGAVIRRLGAVPRRVDLLDAGQVEQAVADERADAVVNLATSIPPPSRAWRRSAWRLNDRLRVEASAHLAQSATRHGARFVQESFALALPSLPGVVIDEDVALEPTSRMLSAVVAERHAHEVTDGGGIGTVLRFAWLAGPTAPQATDVLEGARRTGVVMLPGPPDARIPMVDALDAGRAVAAALTVPAGNYHVVEDEVVTRREHADHLARALGRKVRLPPALLAKGPMEILARDQHLGSSKLQQRSGWRPSTPSVARAWAGLLEEVAP